jgi:hypothetical protein
MTGQIQAGKRIPVVPELPGQGVQKHVQAIVVQLFRAIGVSFEPIGQTESIEPFFNANALFGTHRHRRLTFGQIKRRERHKVIQL